ncbi:MAG: helix-turn-helix transcriptional regulator [Pseudonocardiales bacterium]|nr:helix-turn-helix transcriptional regulator [Pseudonocardiales bacterium]
MLRRIRKDAGLSGESLATALSVSQSHLSRVELGDTAAGLELVGRWVQECGAGTDDRAAATELAESVTVEFTTWRSAMASGLPAIQREIAAAEAAAATRCAWVPMLIPGLLQTASYTHELITGKYPDREDVAEAVAARMQRQTILYERGKTLRWVIGEAGLRWQVATPDVMAAQLDRLAMLAAEPHLDIRVLPFINTGPVWHDHGFMIRGDRDDGQPDLVNVELLTGPANITEPSEVAEYRRAYERLAELALRGQDAVAFIRQLMVELR